MKLEMGMMGQPGDLARGGTREATEEPVLQPAVRATSSCGLTQTPEPLYEESTRGQSSASSG